MPSFHLAWRAAGSEARLVAEPDTLAAPPTPLLEPARLVLLASETVFLSVSVNPATFSVAPAAHRETLHYFRLADATVRPLPPTPAALTLERGDAYVAVTPAGARLAETQTGGASAAVARFIHLRDYFNADRLAEALLAHLGELGEGAEAAGAGVLVVEAR